MARPGDDFKGGTTSGSTGGGGANPVPTAPGGRTPRPGGYTAPTTSTRDRRRRRDPDEPTGYEKRAVARENEAKAKGSARYRKQAENLEAQARALRHALRIDFKAGRDQQLEDIADVLRDQQTIVQEGYRSRVDSLAGAKSDNEKAEGAQSVLNEANRVRERNSAVSEALSQGAGESDVLAAQMMSLRNWQANQGEVQRSFYDTLRTVNSSLTDLNVDTKTALINNQLQAQSDREQVWTNYYDRTSEAYTQLGNIRGQQADYYAMAEEMAPDGKKGERRRKGDVADAKTANRRAGGAFMSAAKTSGKSWDNPGVGPALMNWTGHAEFGGSTNRSLLAAAPTTSLDKKPEGATLRKW